MQIDLQAISKIPNTIATAMHTHEINKIKEASDVVCDGARTSMASWRTIVVNLGLTR
jgi:hypothetical protein